MTSQKNRKRFGKKDHAKHFDFTSKTGTEWKAGHTTEEQNLDEQPEIGQEAALFESGLVNASMIPDAFGYRSLGENRERISALEEYSEEILKDP
ncbi:MAG TPA: hypothetical protein DHW84_11970 [Firmicutes bacterium]|jgi:hypothetical protein|nr:hypothetical protein [Bacillota bacterium]HCM18941.1 hypothetical protein [Bacillota bacterium]